MMPVAARPTAKTTWPRVPTLVRTTPMREVFGGNHGKFKPQAAFVTPAKLC